MWDGGRDSYPIDFNERSLEEVYFPPFEAVVQRGNATSVMSAYNSLDGSPCLANPWLLRDKLKGEWRFQGFVTADAGAVGGILICSTPWPAARSREERHRGGT